MPIWCARRWRVFKRGDLFEVVPGQMFYERCETPPSDISRKLKAINPSPYSFFINLGEGEYLIGASPNVRARQRPPCRDLPDLRHDQARRRRDFR